MPFASGPSRRLVPSRAVLLILATACAGERSVGPGAPGSGSGTYSVKVFPSSDTLPVGQSIQYLATVYDSTGKVVTGRPITWTTSNTAIASIDGNGLARALAGGAASVVATAPEGRSGSAALSVLAPGSPPPTASPYPHQPAGYIALAENSFGVLPVYPATASGLSGLWWELTTGSANTSIVSVPSAPRSAPSVIQTRFPAGLQSGSAPAVYGGWDRGEGGSTLSKMYVSMWVRILGTDFENQLVGTKIAYLGFARNASTALNDGYLWICGDGVQGVHSTFNLEFRQQNNVGRNLPQNVDVSKIFTVGPWHHFELVLELNALGSANGKIKWWVDDRLILDYSNVLYIVPGATSGFQGFKVDPVWGGLGGVRTRDDYMQVDHLYISGVS